MTYKKHDKWYFKTSWLIIAFLCIGPFALPLLWFNPHFNKVKKIIITVGIIILSYYLWILFINSFKKIDIYYKQIFK
jgi:hypothetical protein